MRRAYLTIFATFGCLMLSARGLLAAPLIASDNFESYSPPQAAAGANGGSGFTAAYISDNSNAVRIASESLSYTSGSVTLTGGSNDLQVISATTGTTTNSGGGVDNGTLGRSFASQSGTVYFSFLLRASANATSNNEFFQVGLSNSTGAEPALSMGATGTTASAFDFFARTPAASTSTSPTVFSPGQTYLIVGKASKVAASTDYNQMDLYVNPGLDAEPSTTTASKNGDSTLSSLSTFDIRTARFSASDVFSIDNIKIGTTYADVVPEPASLSFIGLASLGLFARRRRFHSH